MAIAVDDNGYPNWVDFVVTTGGQWLYRKGETCEQMHALKFTTTAKDSEEKPFECNICRAPIANLKDGYFTCQDFCNFYCCFNCFNYEATQITSQALLRHEWMKHNVALDKKDVAKLVESMPEDLLNLVELGRDSYKLFSNERDQVGKSNMGAVWDGWACEKVKGANKCLSGLDNQGRVNAEVRFYYWDDADLNELYSCDKCTKADLLIQVLQLINP